MKTVQFLLNIGTNDLGRLLLNEAYLEGDVVDVEDHVADKLVREKVAREWNDDAQRAEEDRLRLMHEAEVRAATPEARRQIAIDEAKKEADALAKGGPQRASDVRRERRHARPAPLAVSGPGGGPMPEAQHNAGLPGTGGAEGDRLAEQGGSEVESSPLSQTNAHEAIDQISRMRSADRLREIAGTETRPTVKKAAEDRLNAIK